MASNTDNPMSGIDEEELALRIARPAGKETQDVLAEMEWKRRLMKEQQELNRAVMLEQHKLNKRIVIITAIIAALSGICGGLIQKYSPDLSWWQMQQNHTQRQSGVSKEETVPQKNLHEIPPSKN